MTINRQILLNFIFDEVTEEQQKKILNEIQKCEIVRKWYLQLKREIDVERYINDEMTIHEKIEFEEVLKADTKLKEHFDLVTEINIFLRIEAFRECLDQIIIDMN